MAFLAYTLLQNCNFGLQVNGIVNAQNPAQINPVSGSITGLSAGGGLQLGVGANQVNILISSYVTPKIPANGTATLTLSNTLTDILNQTGVIVARIRGFLAQLVSTTQDTTNGTACSSVTLGASGLGVWTGILNATGKYTINNGGWWGHGDFSAAGIVVSLGVSDQLAIVNNDAINPAAVRISLFASTI